MKGTDRKTPRAVGRRSSAVAGAATLHPQSELDRHEQQCPVATPGAGSRVRCCEESSIAAHPSHVTGRRVQRLSGMPGRFGLGRRGEDRSAPPFFAGMAERPATAQRR